MDIINKNVLFSKNCPDIYALLNDDPDNNKKSVFGLAHSQIAVVVSSMRPPH